MLTKKKKVTNDRRNLAVVTGDKSVLVVRVIASDDTTTASVSQLSDGVFGTAGDPVNLKSQFYECSREQLNIIPAVRSGITNGVTTVTVNVSTSQGDAVMRNEITSALNTQFGVTSPTQIANHVMYCLPPGTMSGIAYAFINSWMCGYVSVQFHEIGHNLNLAHSNENGEYRDQSGMVSVLICDQTELMTLFEFFVISAFFSFPLISCCI